MTISRFRFSQHMQMLCMHAIVVVAKPYIWRTRSKWNNKTNGIDWMMVCFLLLWNFPNVKRSVLSEEMVCMIWMYVMSYHAKYARPKIKEERTHLSSTTTLRTMRWNRKHKTKTQQKRYVSVSMNDTVDFICTGVVNECLVWLIDLCVCMKWIVQKKSVANERQCAFDEHEFKY